MLGLVSVVMVMKMALIVLISDAMLLVVEEYL
jgi:hypothetical protein